MTTISGFTFIHNAIESGYPIFEAIRAVRDYVDEIVVVDMESTDGTHGLLEDMENKSYYAKFGPKVRVINGKWGNQAGETLKQAHSLYKQCLGDVILHFEADEVYSKSLLEKIAEVIHRDHAHNIEVYRLQLEQNFQRCRWYPEPVHRVWPRNTNLEKNGHTTNYQGVRFVCVPEYGLLWDITNCFRDNWLNRVKKQAELWHGQENYVMVPLHAGQEFKIDPVKAQGLLNEPHWKWETTPFDIPDVLKPLVGMVKYEPRV